MTAYPDKPLPGGRSAFAGAAALAAAVLGFASASSAAAQTSDTTTLGTVVVSATKTPASRLSLTQATTVITGDDLRARGVTRVSDALREVPGASVVQNGSFGSVSSLFIRGGESRYTKILIDGVAVNAPGGFFDFSHLTTDNIERIEIVRGPAGVVYGADAVSGIIQIFTKQGRGPVAVGANVRAGTYGTIDGGVDMSGTAGKARYAIGAAQHVTDGIIPFNNQYYNGTLSASAGFKPREAADVSASARYTAAEFHYPTDFTGAPVDSNAFRVQHRLTVGIDGTTRISPSVTGRLVLGSNDVSDLTENIAVPFGATRPVHSAFTSRSYRRAAEGRLLLRLPYSTTVNIGAEYMRERESSANGEGAVGAPTIPSSSFIALRSNSAVYTEVLGQLTERASYILSARLDDNSDYDRFVTHRIGTSVALAASTRLRGSLSTAFNAPAFNQLRPTLFTVGSPDLDPERTRSYEVGIEQALFGGALRVTADYFNQRFSDLIQFVGGGPPTFLGSFANLTAAESNGYDVEVALAPDEDLSATASYTQASPRVTELSPSYEGGLTVGQALIRRASHTGTAAVRYRRSGVGSLSATANYVGKRPDLDFREFPSPVVTLPSYTRLDLAGSIDVLRVRRAPALALTARVENVFDKRYEDVLNFAAPGRVILIGARYTGSL